MEKRVEDRRWTVDGSRLKKDSKKAITLSLLILLILSIIDYRQSKIEAVEVSPAKVTLLRNEEYFYTLHRMLGEAKKEIVVSIFNFKMGTSAGNRANIIVDDLISASKRGVKVLVVFERGKGREAGDENKKTADILKKGGVSVRFDSPHRTTHTKVVVIDRRYVFIGSHNLSQSALKYNNELSVLIDSIGVAKESLEYILKIE
ncbi:MAG: phospholipase D-like domain-containing protein [Nitrospirota bacterium]